MNIGMFLTIVAGILVMYIFIKRVIPWFFEKDHNDLSLLAKFAGLSILVATVVFLLREFF